MQRARKSESRPQTCTSPLGTQGRPNASVHIACRAQEALRCRQRRPWGHCHSHLSFKLMRGKIKILGKMIWPPQKSESKVIQPLFYPSVPVRSTDLKLDVAAHPEKREWRPCLNFSLTTHGGRGSRKEEGPWKGKTLDRQACVNSHKILPWVLQSVGQKDMAGGGSSNGSWDFLRHVNDPSTCFVMSGIREKCHE